MASEDSRPLRLFATEIATGQRRDRRRLGVIFSGMVRIAPSGRKVPPRNGGSRRREAPYPEPYPKPYLDQGVGQHVELTI